MYKCHIKTLLAFYKFPRKMLTPAFSIKTGLYLLLYSVSRIVEYVNVYKQAQFRAFMKTKTLNCPP